MFEENLTQIGLSKEESELYLSLLNNGPQSATQLSKSTSVKRTYVYALSEGLIKKGLIRQEKEGRGTTFHAQSPDNLLDIAETKKMQLEQAKIGLENIIPQLKTQFSLVEEKPLITYYEGLSGIKKVYLDTLKSKTDILAIVETSKVHQDVYDWLITDYAKKRINNNINVKAIVATGDKTENYTNLDEKELRETKIIDSTKFPFEHEINLYDDKLAIINHNKESHLIGIIIQNNFIASTFHSWFNLTWNS